jgi:hypothetical protein
MQTKSSRIQIQVGRIHVNYIFTTKWQMPSYKSFTKFVGLYKVITTDLNTNTE